MNLAILTIVFGVASESLASRFELNKNLQDRHNKQINKGVWIKNKFNSASYEKPKRSDFIFHNSVDSDIANNNFDGFNNNGLSNDLNEVDAFLSLYNDRAKRSLIGTRNKLQPTKPCKNKSNCIDSNESSIKGPKVEPNILPNIKQGSNYNTYQYPDAPKVLDGIVETIPYLDELDLEFDSNQLTFKDANSAQTKEHDDSYSSPSNNNYNLNVEPYTTNKTAAVIPTEIMPLKIKFNDESRRRNVGTKGLNVTGENRVACHKINSEVNDDDNQVWQNEAVPGVNPQYVVTVTQPLKPIRKDVLKVNSKREKEFELKDNSSKPLSEKSLVKVLAMLTKTFKKLMKQHEEIKQIHKSFNKKNEDFTKNMDYVTSKFQDFDHKYHSMLEHSEKITDAKLKLTKHEQRNEERERDLMRKIQDLENQQRKFLVQQKQFYDIQRLMLSQNEKITLKQNFIAQTQSDISERQINFAKVLNKAKQMYLNTKKLNKLNQVNPKPKYTEDTDKVIALAKTKDLTTTEPSTRQITAKMSTDTVKINLFSIPVSNKVIPNQDEQIMKEKDMESIDDLVYKFYFNNTFIESLLKTGILANIVTQRDDKREATNDLGVQNTFLFPINNTEENVNEGTHIRNRRWIHHHQRHSKRNHAKSKPDQESRKSFVDKSTKNNEANPSDPFTLMAKNFCNQIQQNTNEQVLSWCIEKALRRLQHIDIKPPGLPLAQPPTSPRSHLLPQSPLSPPKSVVTRSTSATEMFLTTVAMAPEFAVGMGVSEHPTTTANSVTRSAGTDPTTSGNGFFPDNDELELKLQEYELKPDTEGNVYFDGSVHVSDLANINATLSSEDEGASDVIPGMDSDSRADIDPRTLDLLTKRREAVRLMNAQILKNIKKKQKKSKSNTKSV